MCLGLGTLSPGETDSGVDQLFTVKVGSEAPMRAEFLQKRLISAFFGFQWQNLAEILRLFKKYNILRKVAE